MSKDKLNNLLSIEDYSDKKFFKGTKTTKRTEVAKDILENVDITGKIVDDKPESKHDAVVNKLHNICSIDEFTEKEFLKDNKPTKRTEVAKDVLLEKRKSKKHYDDEDDDDDECDCKKNKFKKNKKDEEDEEEKPKKGLTAAQKKLPKGLQDAILKKQGK